VSVFPALNLSVILKQLLHTALIATVPRLSSGKFIQAAPRSSCTGETSALMLAHVRNDAALLSWFELRLSPLTTDPADGVQLKIWQCFDHLPAQQWFYTADSRIALEGKG
jgi:hypothetical protein